ncbi:MAG: Gal-P uridylyltransferase [Betaproteobacteria bacterium]|nr:Gal-P uridylyltransferase [Betaproteobacteria bacterium]
MHTLELTKPDGRSLTLYSRRPLPSELRAPSPFPRPLEAQPHLRWHPLRAEWVTYATYRQDRPFLPPVAYNPLAPTVDPAAPTEVPDGDWDVAVFDNRFPSLSLGADLAPELIVPTAPATGKCEVVVYSRDATASLGRLPLAHIELLIEVWGERTQRIAQAGPIEYVLPFENRGAEVGVTLHHPHGQIYAYRNTPPVPKRMLDVALDYYAAHGRGPLAELIQGEIKASVRMLYAGEHAVAFIPVCARYPYEVWIAPIAPVDSFSALLPVQRADLARAMKTVLLKYDGLWQRPFPYLMAWYQAPTDGRSHPECHLHAELYPPYRTRDKLKYLAGTEIAAGFFAMDALPENKAQELQQVKVDIDGP